MTKEAGDNREQKDRFRHQSCRARKLGGILVITFQNLPDSLASNREGVAPNATVAGVFTPIPCCSAAINPDEGQ